MTHPATCYEISRASLSVEADDEILAAQVQHLWQTVFQLPLRPCAGTPTLGFHLRGEGAIFCPPQALPLRTRGPLQIWRTPTGFHLQSGAGVLVVDMMQGQVEGLLPPEFWGQPLNQQRELFSFALFFLLRSHGLYALHGNALEHPGGGVLIAAPSGSGKTTLTLTLMAAGWRCVGDDVLFAEVNADGVIVHPLRRGISCTRETLAYFPALPVAEDAPILARDKRLLVLAGPEEAMPAPTSRPRVLLLPQIVDQPSSSIHPLPGGAALFVLLQQTVGMLLDESLAPLHLQTLTRLVSQTRAYRLHLGRDGLENPGAVVTLVERQTKDD
jgi:hypothetical protein